MQNKSTISKKFQNTSLGLRSLYLKLIVAGFATIFMTVQSVGFVQAAGSAQLSLSPASGSYEINNTLKVTINSTSTDAINAVQADLNYDASKLELLSIDKSISDFTLACYVSGGSGSVKVGCADSATLTGTKIVASVSFKVLAGSGTTSITFAPGNALVRPSDAQNVWNGNTSAGTYTLTSPPPPATTTTTTTTTTTPAPTQTPKPTPKSPQPSSPSPTPSEPDTTVPAATEIPGYLVAVKIIDKDGKPIIGKTVYLGSQLAVSDDSGVASFVNVKPGSYKITEDKDGKGKVLGDVTVNDTPSDPNGVQQFEIKPPAKSKILVYVIPAGIFIGLIILLLVSRSAFEKFRSKRREFKKHFPNQPKNNSGTTPTESPTGTISQSVQPEQNIAPSNTEQTILPNSAPENSSKKPIVWSGDDK